MTQEEKAKAYDEAIERAKEVYDAYRFSMDTSNFNPTDIEYIFPQLAESEDEKIRKWLYDYIERVGKTWGKQPFHYEQILDWIEKQKEQKPWELSEEETKVLDSIIDDYEKAANSFCGYDGKICLLRAIRDGLYNLPKHTWSEADEKLFWGFTAWVPNDELERLGVTRDDILKKLKSLRPLYE